MVHEDPTSAALQKYQEAKERSNADPALNYETNQRRIGAAGLEYDRERRELEERRAADSNA